MHDRFSVTAAGVLSVFALASYSRQGSATSADARAVAHDIASAVRPLEDSAALFGPRAVALSELRLLAFEHRSGNWDGAGACPLSARAVERVEAFIRALPEDLPLPDFAADPDGEVSLDWMASRDRMLSLSIGPGDRVAFAWLDGSSTGHGVERFDGVSLPLRLLREIQAFAGHAGLRAA